MLDWLYTAISWVMKQWHALFSTFLDPAAGITWALSIMFLVVTVRLILFPLFVKQVKSQRAMQELQPEIQKLRKQYGSDRQGMSQAMMALQKERGVNPLAGCLPILPQIPVFLALFHVLRRLAPGVPRALRLVRRADRPGGAKAKLFGAPISASFNMTGAKEEAILALPGVTYANIRIVAFVLIVIMCITTFITQKQIMKRSGPVEGQAAMVQKFLLYGMPLSLFVSGFFFPIGVLLYWIDQQPVDPRPAVLHPAQDAAARIRRRTRPRPPPSKPVIDPKTLAPKPGAKPVRPKGGRPAPPSTAGATALTDGATDGTAARRVRRRRGAGTANGSGPGAGAGGGAGNGSGKASPGGRAPGGKARLRARPNRGKRKRR